MTELTFQQELIRSTALVAMVFLVISYRRWVDGGGYRSLWGRLMDVVILLCVWFAVGSLLVMEMGHSSFVPAGSVLVALVYCVKLRWADEAK